VVELFLDIEYPVAIVVLLFTATISIVGRTADAKRLLHILGLDVARFDYAGLSLLALRLCAAALLLAAVYPFFKWRVGPGRRRPLLP
jgi:hypothetical protein